MIVGRYIAANLKPLSTVESKALKELIQVQAARAYIFQQ